jgi:hypothetical protein
VTQICTMVKPRSAFCVRRACCLFRLIRFNITFSNSKSGFPSVSLHTGRQRPVQAEAGQEPCHLLCLAKQHGNSGGRSFLTVKSVTFSNRV